MSASAQAQTPSVGAPSHFRADINGMRALAVIAVVAFHAGWAFVPGGFVGVDIFFVISGFLITQHLLREIEIHGSVNLLAFWARRLRRLSPALVTVIIVSTMAGLYFLSPLEWEQMAADAIAASLYVSNMLFAVTATDYFADGQVQSALLHTWSLSVEEQFYIVWPLLVLVAFFVAKQTNLPMRKCIAVGFSLVFVMSLTLSIYFTNTFPAQAFYVLPTRAWEFAAAGILACIPERCLRFRAGTRSIVGSLGLVLLAMSCFGIQPSDPFPGVVAAIPVIAALLLIVSGMGNPSSNGIVQIILCNRVLQWVGNRSYSWYLWHWPFIILSSAAFDSESIVVKTTAATLSVVAGHYSYRFVENIIRDNSALKNSSGRSFVVAGGLIACVSCVAVSAFVASSIFFAQPAQAKFKLARDQVPTTSCAQVETTASGDELCIFGNPEAERTVVLVGDSHAGQWKAAFAQAAKNIDMRLIVRWKSNCPVNGLNAVSTTGTPVVGCPEFTAVTQRITEDTQPDAVIIAHSNAYIDRIIDKRGEKLKETEMLRLWKQSYSLTIDGLNNTGAKVAVIADNPHLNFDPLECATRRDTSPDECRMDKDLAFESIETLDSLDRIVWYDHGIKEIFSVGETLCDDGISCRSVEADGTPIYRDSNHLAEQWTILRQLPGIEEFLAQAVKRN